MTECNMKNAPDPKDVQDFLFKQAHISQIFEGFTLDPSVSNLVAADGKRGLLYIGHSNKLTILKLGNDAKLQWKADLDLPDVTICIALNCDCTFLAIAFARPSVLIYNASSFAKNYLELYHEIRVSSLSEDARVSDLRWNPAVSGMLSTIATDHTVGSFQIKSEKGASININAMERLPGLEALCVAWSPKGKQLVIGCRNGNIVQLKPDLKVARMIPGPSPAIGGVVAILWLSNYQFCVAYLEMNVHSVLIIDAPKNQAIASFTRYEDIMYRVPDANGGFPRFYFDHIAEWGIIIVGSNDCSEIAVLGSIDSGVTWEQWQLMDSGRAELPLMRTRETYPLGITIDKFSTQKLMWDSDTKLPNPVPILHILSTSGQLCSFHIVNLKPGCPNICAAPTENVNPPPVQRPSVPVEVSFSLPSGATSTPLIKQNESQIEKPINAPMMNLFGTNSGVSKTMNSHLPQNQVNLRIVPTSETTGPYENMMKNTGFLPQGEPKTVTQGDAKPGIQMQSIMSKNTGFALPNEASKNIEFQGQIQTKTGDLVQQRVDNKAPKPREEKVQALTKIEVKTPVVKEVTPQEKTHIDDGICLRAYREEQMHFEKELKSKLEPIIWECGTEDERRQLVEKSVLIEDFFKELRETTTGLANDIAYLKSLLLQSFAWLEETKSKSLSHTTVTSRSRSDNSKLAELQRLLYYTQSQLLQVTKVLDLEWADQHSRERQKMKIPNMEFIYQSLMRHRQIISKQKSIVDILSKKLKSFGKSNNITGLNHSMANLNVSSVSSKVSGNEYAIELKCKTIANKIRNFSREKQLKLRDLLAETTPRIIKAADPTSVQDRLEATLSSLASLNKIPTEIKPKIQQNITKHRPQIKVQQSPLPSLNNMVARIGAEVTPVQQSTPQSTISQFTTSGTKMLPFSPATTLSISKQDTTISFTQSNIITQSSQVSTFPKLDSISFGSSSQKLQEPVSLTKDSFSKSTATIVEPPKSETVPFTNFTIKSILPTTSQELSGTVSNISTSVIQSTSSSTPMFSTSKPMFNLANPVSTSLPTSMQSFSFTTAKPAGTNFAFPPSTSSTSVTQTSQPSTQSSLDLTGLSTGLQQPEFPINISLPQATTAAPVAPLPSPLLFKTPQISLFAKTSPTTTSSPSSIASGMVISPAFCRTTTTSVTATTMSEKISTTAPSVIATISPTSPIFGATTTFATPVSAPTVTITQAGLTMTTTSSAAPTTTTTAITLTTPVTSTTTPAFSFLAASTAPTTTTSSFSTITTSVFSNTGFENLLSNTSPLSFGISTSSVTITPVFGKVTTPAPTGNVFGKAINGTALSFGGTSITPSTTSGFGNANVTAGNSSIFGGGTTFGSTATTTTVNTPTFGSPAITTTSSPVFGGSTTTTASSPSFGNITVTSSSIFGSAAKPTTTSAHAFGAVTTSVSGTRLFGSDTTNTSSSSIFGAATSTANSNSLFGGTATANTGSSTSIFGAKSPITTSSSIFGGGATSTFGTVGQTSVFGDATKSQSSIFGGSGAAGIFGGTTATAAPLGGSSIMAGSGQSVFGQSATFGSKPVFGAQPSEFGMKPVFGTGFGAMAFGTSPTAAGFGSPPTLGSGLPPQMGAPDSMQKVFGGSAGSNTFETLAGQSGGLSFSSLAQKTTEPEKAPTFSGGSSFSSWR